MGDQSVDNLVQISIQEVFQFVDCQVNSVIGYTTLREVVCPDSLGTVSASHLAPALCRDLVVLLLEHQVVQTGLQYLEGFVLILNLGFLILAGYHQSGRNVGQTNRRVRGVDALSAGAAGAKHVDAQVVLVDVDLNLIGLG